MGVKVKKHSGQCGMSKLFRKTSEVSAIFWRKLAEKIFWQKISQHSAQLDGASSVNAKTSVFPCLLYRQYSKIYPLPGKKLKIENFIANNSPKKSFRPPKIWKIIDRDLVVVVLFIQKLDKSDQWVRRKLYLKRWNAERCHGREKTKSFWRVLVRRGFSPLA